MRRVLLAVGMMMALLAGSPALTLAEPQGAETAVESQAPVKKKKRAPKKSRKKAPKKALKKAKKALKKAKKTLKKAKKTLRKSRKAGKAAKAAVSPKGSKADVLNKDPAFQGGAPLPPPQTPGEEQ